MYHSRTSVGVVSNVCKPKPIKSRFHDDQTETTWFGYCDIWKLFNAVSSTLLLGLLASSLRLHHVWVCNIDVIQVLVLVALQQEGRKYCQATGTMFPQQLKWIICWNVCIVMKWLWQLLTAYLLLLVNFSGWTLVNLVVDAYRLISLVSSMWSDTVSRHGLCSCSGCVPLSSLSYNKRRQMLG